MISLQKWLIVPYFTGTKQIPAMNRNYFIAITWDRNYHLAAGKVTEEASCNMDEPMWSRSGFTTVTKSNGIADLWHQHPFRWGHSETTADCISQKNICSRSMKRMKTVPFVQIMTCNICLIKADIVAGLRMILFFLLLCLLVFLRS